MHMYTVIPLSDNASRFPFPANDPPGQQQPRPPGKLAPTMLALLLSAPCALSHAGPGNVEPTVPPEMPEYVISEHEVIDRAWYDLWSKGVDMPVGKLSQEERETGARMRVNSSIVSTRADGAAGVHSHVLGSPIVAVSDSTIRTEGDAARGIHLFRSPLESHDTTITTYGRDSAGILVQSGTRSASSVRGGKITTYGRNAHGVIADASPIALTDVNIHTEGTKAAGIVALDTDVELKNVKVDTRGDVSAGILVSGGTLAAQDSSIHAWKYSAILVANESGKDTNISLKNTRVRLWEDRRLPFVEVRTPNAATAGAVTLLMSEKSKAYGDIVRADLAADSGALHLKLDDSTWQGKTTALDHVDIAHDGQWQLTGDSRIQSMTMQDGHVLFEPFDGTPASTLTIAKDLTGDGRFSMQADIAQRQADRLVVHGIATGRFDLQVQATGKEPSGGEGALNLVQTRGGQASFTLANRGGRAELGVYQYELRRSEENGRISWDLVAATDQPAAPATPDAQARTAAETVKRTKRTAPATTVVAEASGTGEVIATRDAASKNDAAATRDTASKNEAAAQAATSAASPAAAAPALAIASRPARPRLSALASDVVNTASFAGTQRIWNAEIGALGLRADALRNGEACTGLWADGFGGRQQLDNGAGRGFSQTVQGFHVGVDRVIAVEGGRWNVGVAAGHSGTRRDFGDEGKGATGGLHAAIYAGMQHDSGFYANGAITAAGFRNQINAKGSDGRTATARYGNAGTGVSLTAGRRWTLAGNWFLEPQGGADWFRLGSASYRTRNGMTVEAASADSLQLRGALRVGKRFDLADGGSVTPFLQVGVVHELGGNSRTTLNGIRLDSRTAGARLETGLGVNADLGKGHSLSAGYNYAKGSNYRQPWALTVGYRYAF